MRETDDERSSRVPATSSGVPPVKDEETGTRRGLHDSPYPLESVIGRVLLVNELAVEVDLQTVGGKHRRAAGLVAPEEGRNPLPTATSSPGRREYLRPAAARKAAMVRAETAVSPLGMIVSSMSVRMSLTDMMAPIFK